MQEPSEFLCISEGGIIKNLEKFSKSLPFWCRFDGYQLRRSISRAKKIFVDKCRVWSDFTGYHLERCFSSMDENNLWILLSRGVFLTFSSATTWGDVLMLILRIQVCFFLTYRALKVAGNYRPERRKMGFDLRTFGAMLGGIYHKKCCLQSLLLLLASIGFVINSRLPLMRPSSLASIAFVMTGVLARLSISLSKHWDLVPTAVCLLSFHS